ncbi:transketolase [Kribbella sp. NPDC056345]|uniref:transketolase n=1 Tax=Kribbella sp. NPDC056345 TaxID=3345789 RepID=UPI0035D7224E
MATILAATRRICGGDPALKADEGGSLSDHQAAAPLEEVAARLRRRTLEMISAAGAGHPGSSLSVIEILTALYYDVLRWDPAAPDAPDRDRFVLSKGHAAPALYAVLLDTGVVDAAWADSLRTFRSPLQGHPDPRFTPGIEFPAGSLAQALSASVGLALGLHRAGSPARTFVLVGDGECQEGQVWEAAAFAAHHRLDGLTVIVDDNRLQHDAPTAAIAGAGSLVDRWKACGFETEVVPGHELDRLTTCLRRRGDRRPRAVVARTVKGKGVDFMEDSVDWHSVFDAARLPEAVASLADRAL